MKKIALISMFLIIFVSGGCNVVGFIASPTRHEEKVPAQFLLSDRQKDNITVIVHSDRASGMPAGMEEKMELLLSGFLVSRAKINSRYIVPAAESSPLGAEEDLLDKYTPAEIGRNAGADTVLLVVVNDCRVEKISDRGYFTGQMVSHSLLIDAKEDKILWPDTRGGFAANVKVDVETNGHNYTLQRLAASTSHCITRNLYNCSRAQYRTRDEIRMITED